MANIKQVNISNTTYDIEALHFIAGDLNTPAQWKAYIDNTATVGIQIVIDTQASGKEEPATSASASTMGKLYFVAISGTEAGTYTEFITLDKGTDASPRYVWEKIGTTATDLSEYLKKATTYSDAALSAGAHTHTVTVPTVAVDKTKKLGATASGTAVGADGTDSFVKSYPGTTSKLVTTSITGVSGSTTASKATAGTAVTVATRASSQTTVGNANVGTAVSIPNVTANTNVTTTFVDTPAVATVKAVNTVTAGTAASFTQGSKAAWSATVSSAGVLSFSFTANGDDSFTANTPTAVSTSNVTGVVRSNASTPKAENKTATATTLGTAISVTPATASTTKIYAVGGTENITPYTFADVDVPVAAEAATTVATGSLNATASGASVMTGLGTPTKADALTGVKVTAQPTITISESTSNTGPVNEHVTTGTNSATTESSGAHTHDIKVNS